MGRKGEAGEGEGELWEGRVRHRTAAEAWERKELAQAVNHLLISPPLHLADLHE